MLRGRAFLGHDHLVNSTPPELPKWIRNFEDGEGLSLYLSIA
jgi:hypothetical protein